MVPPSFGLPVLFRAGVSPGRAGSAMSEVWSGGEFRSICMFAGNGESEMVEN